MGVETPNGHEKLFIRELKRFMETPIRSELSGREFDVDVGIVTIHSRTKAAIANVTHHEVYFVSPFEKFFPTYTPRGK
jgi:hypothetical protein